MLPMDFVVEIQGGAGAGQVGESDGGAKAETHATAGDEEEQ